MLDLEFFCRAKRSGWIPAITHWYPYQSSIDVCSNTSHQNTSVTAVCWLQHVVSFLIIFMDRGSCFSRNVSLIIQIWKGLFYSTAACYRWSVISSPNLIKNHFLNFGYHSTVGIPVIRYSYVILIKNNKYKNAKTKIQRNHKPHIFLNKQRCWQHSMVLSRCHLIFTNSDFWT